MEGLNKRKYIKGDKITSFDELMSQEFIYYNGKIYHFGWFGGWQARWIKIRLDRGCFYKAVKKESDNGD